MPVCLRMTMSAPQSLHHQQDVQRLHSQFAALLQDTLGAMRARLEEEYGAACGAS